MAKYTSNRQRELKVGITSYTENLTVLEVTGGAYISSSVGIGTTIPTQSLHVQGNTRISGAVYDSTNKPGLSGQVLQSTVTGIVWSNASGITTYADKSGIATYATYAGYATTAGIATVAGYASTAGIATNLAGGAKNSIPYQTDTNTTGFISYGNPGDILTTDGNNSAPYWAPLNFGTIPARLTVRDEGQIVGTASSISQLDFRGPNIVATAEPFGNIATITVVDYVSNSGYATYSGIATYATDSGIATYATYSGIATYATYSGIATYATDSGIATYATRAGIATYATDSGIATYATYSGIATYATDSGIATYATYSGIATYAGSAGISTDVIGGIASVSSLYVSGISTLGTVLVSSGIVSATTGVVTYYGDGSKLTGIQTSGVVTVIDQDPTVSSPVYPTLVSNIGISSLGISTTKLSFIPSTNKLGLGTEFPRENLDVVGTIGIQSSGTSNRFYIEHNSAQNSLDFIFV
jgi:hypothetical protein